MKMGSIRSLTAGTAVVTVIVIAACGGPSSTSYGFTEKDSGTNNASSSNNNSSGSGNNNSSGSGNNNSSGSGNNTGSSGSSGSSGGASATDGGGGGSCSTCSQDSDCQTACGTPDAGGIYCCMAGMCIPDQSGTCPSADDSGGGSGDDSSPATAPSM